MSSLDVDAVALKAREDGAAAAAEAVLFHGGDEIEAELADALTDIPSDKQMHGELAATLSEVRKRSDATEEVEA